MKNSIFDTSVIQVASVIGLNFSVDLLLSILNEQMQR
jgi:hypothetical protein